MVVFQGATLNSWHCVFLRLFLYSMYAFLTLLSRTVRHSHVEVLFSLMYLIASMEPEKSPGLGDIVINPEKILRIISPLLNLRETYLRKSRISKENYCCFICDWQSRSKSLPKSHQCNETEKTVQAARILQSPTLTCGLLVLAKCPRVPCPEETPWTESHMLIKD